MKAGERARRKRRELGLTLREVAAQANVSLGMLSEWECGEKDMTLNRAADVARVLGVSLDWLVRVEDGPRQSLVPPQIRPIIVDFVAQWLENQDLGEMLTAEELAYCWREDMG